MTWIGSGKSDISSDVKVSSKMNFQPEPVANSRRRGVHPPHVRDPFLVTLDALEARREEFVKRSRDLITRPRTVPRGWALVDGKIVPPESSEEDKVLADEATLGDLTLVDFSYVPIKVVIAPPLRSLPSTRWVHAPVASSPESSFIDLAFATRFSNQLLGYYEHRLLALEVWLTQNAATHPFHAGCRRLREVLNVRLEVTTPEKTLEGILRGLHDPENGLDSITGREKVKLHIRSILKAFASSWRSFEGFNNTLLYGGPGSGKTSLARLIAWVYGSAGLLETTKYEVCTGADLVGKYLGHSAPQTRDVYSRSMGGVLLIDEAYQVRGSNEKAGSFGDEAIAELVNLMDKLPYVYVIAAGYKDRIKEHFLDTNAGLRRRFTTNIELEPFEPIELAEMCVKDLGKRVSLHPSDSAVIRDLILEVGSETFTGQAGDALTLAQRISRELLCKDVPFEKMNKHQRATCISEAFKAFLRERL